MISFLLLTCWPVTMSESDCHHLSTGSPKAWAHWTNGHTVPTALRALYTPSFLWHWYRAVPRVFCQTLSIRIGLHTPHTTSSNVSSFCWCHLSVPSKPTKHFPSRWKCCIAGKQNIPWCDNSHSTDWCDDLSQDIRTFSQDSAQCPSARSHIMPLSHTLRVCCRGSTMKISPFITSETSLVNVDFFGVNIFDVVRSQLILFNIQADATLWFRNTVSSLDFVL